jgi:hypothetical protein
MLKNLKSTKISSSMRKTLHLYRYLILLQAQIPQLTKRNRRNKRERIKMDQLKRGRNKFLKKVTRIHKTGLTDFKQLVSSRLNLWTISR